MTRRGRNTLAAALALLLVTLSTGNSACGLLFTASALALLLMFLSILLARLTLSVTQSMQSTEVTRLMSCELNARFRIFSLFPLAPLTLHVCLPSGRESIYLLRVHPWGHTDSLNTFSCPHVGTVPVGVRRVILSDVMGLFCISKTIRTPLASLRVLPQAAAVSPVPVHLGTEDGMSSAYAASDNTTPEGIRDWVQGDELKRVHWKLSARRQTLLVRTYEQLQRPDILILLNTSISPGAPQRASVIDALTESCAGAIHMLLSEDRPVCMPIPETGTEFRGTGINAFPEAQRLLASISFKEQDHFPEILELSAPRLQRSDTLLIFSPVISPAIAESVIRLSQFGTNLRFTLACPGEPGPHEMKLLQMLVSANIETYQVSIS